MLFSEPKISQSAVVASQALVYQRFSALQRAENFSMERFRQRLRGYSQRVSVLFSEPKISQFAVAFSVDPVIGVSFSALQRAENFSIDDSELRRERCERFSALQRAENFSMFVRRTKPISPRLVSVLFSEPKISQ